jgi:NAD(P)-dependent dehydrogenase (short-subunit alcohol dehydrogenase family)
VSPERVALVTGASRGIDDARYVTGTVIPVDGGYLGR